MSSSEELPESGWSNLTVDKLSLVIEKLFLADKIRLRLRESEPESESRWSNLPEDILKLVVLRLYLSDRIRSGLVCKSWFLNPIPEPFPEIHRVDKLPWVMLHGLKRSYNGETHGVCKLVDPCGRKIYGVEEATKKGNKRDEFIGSCIRATKCGWVLFSKDNQDVSRVFFYLYCPFTDEVIRLPETDREYLESVTFSLDSGSPDCVVYCVRRIRWERHFYISTCRPGDTKWTHLFEFKTTGSEVLKGIAYARGTLYCLFQTGKLGAFNVASKVWTLFSQIWSRKFYHALSYYLIPFSRCGVLRVVMKLSINHWEILRFDVYSKRWVNENSLGNQAVFISHTSFSVVATHELPLEENLFIYYNCFIKSSSSLSETYAWVPRDGLGYTWIESPVTGFPRKRHEMTEVGGKKLPSQRPQTHEMSRLTDETCYVH